MFYDDNNNDSGDGDDHMLFLQHYNCISIFFVSLKFLRIIFLKLISILNINFQHNLLYDFEISINNLFTEMMIYHIYTSDREIFSKICLQM